MIILESQSVRTVTALYTFDSGNSPIMSTDIYFPGFEGILLGCNGLCGFSQWVFILWHISHLPYMYS
jgi:hypothetical protein